MITTQSYQLRNTTTSPCGAKAKTGIFQNGVIGKCTTLIMHIPEKAQQKSKAKPAQKSKKPRRAKTVFTTSHAQHTIKITKITCMKKLNL